MRWGIAGYGWVARDYMTPAIRAVGDELAGIADPGARAREAAREEGVPAYEAIERLLAAGVDALYVASPNDAHLQPVRAAAAAGVPVLCEKPMAATLAQAEEMADAVREGGILYGTAFDQRHHPAHVALRDALQRGAIGRPAAVRIVYACWVDPLWSATPDSGPNWRADPRAAGGGATIDLALHGLDLTEMLLEAPLADLHLMLQRRIHDYPVDDGGLLVGRAADGTLLSLHVSYNCPEALPRRRLEVVGETGQLVATDTMGQTAGGSLVRVDGRTGGAEPIAFDALRSPFEGQARAFRAAVTGGPHDYSLERDIRLTRLFHCAHEEALRCL